jgi:glycosyltransferase involved in cell wall biosynthesis
MACRVLYLVSDIDKAVSFEWIATHFQRQASFQLSFCFLLSSPSATVELLVAAGVPCHIFYINGKRSWPSIVISILRLIRTQQPDVIHCHLLKASLLGLTAASLASVPVRIFTRHHGSMHHTTHRKGLLWDSICNTLSTSIVSISPVTTEILTSWEHVPTGKIVSIPHGFALESFVKPSSQRSEAFKRAHHLSGTSFIVGAVSRFEHEKGVQDTVQAAVTLISQGHDIHLLLLNAAGSYSAVIHSLLASLPPDSWTCLPFESDMAAAYAAMDVLVHVPISPYVEAFGQVYIEGLAASVPLVCTLSGIASQVIVDQSNALVVPFCSPQSIASSIHRLIQDHPLRDRLSSNGPPSVCDTFSLDTMFARLEQLYLYSSSQDSIPDHC